MPSRGQSANYELRITNYEKGSSHPFVIRHSSFVIHLGATFLLLMGSSPPHSQMLTAEISSDEAYVG
jgi:hypothetical protein